MEGGTVFPALLLILTLSFLLSMQTIAHMKVVEFQGNHKANSPPAPPMTLQPITNLDLTPSPDVPLAILKRKMMASNDIKVARRLLMEINTHLKVKTDKSLLRRFNRRYLFVTLQISVCERVCVFRSGRRWLKLCAEWLRW